MKLFATLLTSSLLGVVVACSGAGGDNQPDSQWASIQPTTLQASIVRREQDFTVVLRWDRGLTTERVVWRSRDEVQRWDFMRIENGEPAGGRIFLQAEDATTGATTGRDCLWSRSVNDRGMVYVVCGQNSRPVGPNTEWLNDALSATYDRLREGETIAGFAAKCYGVSARDRPGVSVCVTDDTGIPLTIEGRSGRLVSGSVQTDVSEITLPLGPGVSEQVVPWSQLKLPPAELVSLE